MKNETKIKKPKKVGPICREREYINEQTDEKKTLQYCAAYQPSAQYSYRKKTIAKNAETKNKTI